MDGTRTERDELDEPPMPTEAELRAMMAASEADFRAGRTIPLAPKLAEMRAEAARIRQERLARDKAARAPR